MTLENIHIVPNYFLNATHEISVVLIGCGGNGSLMLSRLARIDYALRNSNRLGLNLTVYDNDIVEEYNIGRQMFSIGDIGENKAVTICSKINRNFCTTFKAVPEKFLLHSTFSNRNLITSLKSKLKTTEDSTIMKILFIGWI